MALSKTMLALLRLLTYPDPSIKKNYLPMRQMINATANKPLKTLYRTWDHQVLCGDHHVPVRIFAPVSGLNHPVLIFFHGGGWVTGSIDSYDRICTNMVAATGHVVVSVDYRLAPEHPFPAAPEDCYAVTREVLLNAPCLFHTDPKNVTLIGDSAGGNLAAAVSLMARDRGEFLPYRQIMIYPATNNDHTPSSAFESIRTNGKDYLLTSKRVCEYMDLYAQNPEDRQNPYFAPLISAELTHQPRTLILTAEFDPLRDEGEAYGEALRKAGNHVEIRRIPDALHGFLSLPLRFPPVKHAFRLINHFLRERELVDEP